MITSKIDLLQSTVELAIEQLKPTSVQQLKPQRWKIVYQEVEIQIAIDDTINPEYPSLTLYLILFELPQENRGACLEELMQAHFYGLSKYALFQDFLVRIMDFPYTDSLTIETMQKTICIYAEEIAKLRMDLYQRYFEK